MTLRNPRGARRYNDRIQLTYAKATQDRFGHALVGEAVPVLEVPAEVRQMSSTKTMMTFQQADVIGVDIEFRTPAASFNGIVWRGHTIHCRAPEILDNRGRIVRVSGWYQIDDPVQEAVEEEPDDEQPQ